MRKITSLLTALLFVVTTAMAQVDYEPRNNGTKTRGDRNVSQVSLTSGTYGVSSYDLTGAEQSQDWTDKTASVVFKAAPGETVTVAAKTTGSWVHYSVFIDVDADGFTSGIEGGSTWKPTGDLVAYSFYNNNGADDNSGWNSVGDDVAGQDRNKPAIPAFAVPSVAGTYRMRIVQDWCSIDPAGDADGKFSDFKANGGQIIDVTLEVAEAPAAPDPTLIVLDNSKAYLLHNPNGHGYLMYAPAKSEDNVWVSGEEGKSHANFEVQAVDKTSANFYWQIINYNGKTYLYNVGAQKFVTTGGPCKLVGTPTSINMTTLADLNAYAFNTGTGDLGFMCASEHQGHFVNAPVQYWSSDDAGSKWVVEENTELLSYDNTTALVMIQNYEGALTAEGILASYDGVGYPVDSERELLATAAANSKADCKSTTNLAALAAAAESYKSTSNVKMPEDGKAYTFKNVQKNGDAQYFKYDEANGITLTNDAASASTFICRAKGDKFIFVTTDGKFLTHKGNGGSYKGPNNNTGYTNEYDQTADKFLNDFYVTKITTTNVATNGNTDAIAVTNELLFGYVGIATERHDKAERVYYVLTNTGGFDQANAPFCRHNLTSMLRIDEVEYPNKPVVNDAAGVEGVAAISTFCAPFATVVPNDVEVYIAASDESHYIKLQKVEGEAVPANTGVVLVSKNNELTGKALAMVPATTETLVDATGNLLRADAAAGEYTVDAAVNAYVLGAVDGVAGFYPLSASDRTIKQGKAYLVLESSLSAVKLYFGGDEATGIETVVKENANAPIFDLSGRRVVNVAKGGIYIQNGKKFIVK